MDIEFMKNLVNLDYQKGSQGCIVSYSDYNEIPVGIPAEDITIHFDYLETEDCIFGSFDMALNEVIEDAENLVSIFHFPDDPDSMYLLVEYDAGSKRILELVTHKKFFDYHFCKIRILDQDNRLIFSTRGM